MIRLLALASLLVACAGPQEAFGLEPDELRLNYGRGDDQDKLGSWVEVGVSWYLTPDPAAEEVRALRLALVPPSSPRVGPPTPTELGAPTREPAQPPATVEEDPTARRDRAGVLVSLILAAFGASAAAPVARAALDRRRRRLGGRSP